LFIKLIAIACLVNSTLFGDAACIAALLSNKLLARLGDCLMNSESTTSTLFSIDGSIERSRFLYCSQNIKRNLSQNQESETVCLSCPVCQEKMKSGISWHFWFRLTGRFRDFCPTCANQSKALREGVRSGNFALPRFKLIRAEKIHLGPNNLTTPRTSGLPARAPTLRLPTAPPRTSPQSAVPN
jgi:hypothetical protein